ncbi:hypothetical protein [Okeania sp. SIO3B5]|nr:hypothetical protein [Okeania sp. SIO3B5]
MKPEIIVDVTTDRQLKIPAEIQQQLTPGDRFKEVKSQKSEVRS